MSNLVIAIIIILYLGWGKPVFSAIGWIIGKLVGLLCCSVLNCIDAAKDTETAPEPKKEKPKEKSPALKPATSGKTTLSHEQRVLQCKAIIEDAFKYRDDILDMLEHAEGETIVYSVPDALNRTEREYKAQFGNKKWTAAWLDALTLEFGTPFTSKGSGRFEAKEVTA